MKKTTILIAFITLISLFSSGCRTLHTPVMISPSLYMRTGLYFDTYPIYKYKGDYYLYKHGRYIRHKHKKTKIRYIKTNRYYNGSPIYKFNDGYYLKRKDGSYIKHRYKERVRNRKGEYYEDDRNSKRSKKRDREYRDSKYDEREHKKSKKRDRKYIDSEYDDENSEKEYRRDRDLREY